MSLPKIPPFLSIAILAVAGTAIVAFVHAQTDTKTFSGSATFQSGDAGGSVENNALIQQKVINLQNTGSHNDVFRTTLPMNPEARCGLRWQNDPYPTNTLPNTLPASLDTPLFVNGTTYIVAVCVTKGLPTGPFTWSYKTVSVGSLDAGSEKVIVEVQDTVQVTAPMPCTDSDGGISASTKGIATGTYAGAVASYIAIYGQEPDPNTPKPTMDKFSTYIDHCSWAANQLNEGHCDASGRLQAIGISCPNGCKDGACIVPPSSSPSSLTSASMSSLSSLSTSVGIGGPVTTPSGIPSSVPVHAGPPLPVPSVATPGILPTPHPAPSLDQPRAQTGSSTVQTKVNKAKLKTLKKKQQALRKELRSLERSLLRKKNIAALNQIADLRDELADLDLHDPSAAETLRNLQEEIAELRSVVMKKVKRGG